MIGLGWTEIIVLVLCGVVVSGGTLIAVILPLLTRPRSNDEVARLRAEVDRLREEIERLKREYEDGRAPKPAKSPGDTGISEHPG
jgi:hypothetical protein